MNGLQAAPGDGRCWCHARFGLEAPALNGGLCSSCAGRSPSACATAHTAERVRLADAATGDLAEEIAGMLVRIEVNYERETSGPGSRFEGQRLEIAQARAVLRRLGIELEVTR